MLWCYDRSDVCCDHTAGGNYIIKKEHYEQVMSLRGSGLESGMRSNDATAEAYHHAVTPRLRRITILSR